MPAHGGGHIHSAVFDGDGRKDVALLIQLGPFPNAENGVVNDTLRIAVCMHVPVREWHVSSNS
jgi:hypothetical protein